MQKFLVLYMAPTAVLDGWMKTDPEIRKIEEEKMRGQWQAWEQKYAAHVLETAGAGKTKRITAAGTIDVKNDVMLYSLVEAESHEAAASMFEGHPHLGIPEASIEVMVANTLPGMS